MEVKGQVINSCSSLCDKGVSEWVPHQHSTRSEKSGMNALGPGSHEMPLTSRSLLNGDHDVGLSTPDVPLSTSTGPNACEPHLFECEHKTHSLARISSCFGGSNVHSTPRNTEGDTPPHPCLNTATHHSFLQGHVSLTPVTCSPLIPCALMSGREREGVMTCPIPSEKASYYRNSVLSTDQPSTIGAAFPNNPMMPVSSPPQQQVFERSEVEDETSMFPVHEHALNDSSTPSGDKRSVSQDVRSTTGKPDDNPSQRQTDIIAARLRYHLPKLLTTSDMVPCGIYGRSVCVVNNINGLRVKGDRRYLALLLGCWRSAVNM